MYPVKSGLDALPGTGCNLDGVYYYMIVQGTEGTTATARTCCFQVRADLPSIHAVRTGSESDSSLGDEHHSRAISSAEDDTFFPSLLWTTERLGHADQDNAVANRGAWSTVSKEKPECSRMRGSAVSSLVDTTIHCMDMFLLERCLIRFKRRMRTLNEFRCIGSTNRQTVAQDVAKVVVVQTSSSISTSSVLLQLVRFFFLNKFGSMH